MMRRSNSNPERRRAERAGRRAETIAAWYLRAKFYAIVKQRYKTPVGEIDIIATRGRTTIFVEVKSRKNPRMEFDALASVNRHRIVQAAKFFLAQNPQLVENSLRFDVIFLAPFIWPHHLRGAFDVGD
jgi:putative endonuclease